MGFGSGGLSFLNYTQISRNLGFFGLKNLRFSGFWILELILLRNY